MIYVFGISGSGSSNFLTYSKRDFAILLFRPQDPWDRQSVIYRCEASRNLPGLGDLEGVRGSSCWRDSDAKRFRVAVIRSSRRQFYG